MVYSSTDAERKITERSAVQKKLWKLFELKKIKTSCHYTNKILCFQLVITIKKGYMEDSGLRFLTYWSYRFFKIWLVCENWTWLDSGADKARNTFKIRKPITKCLTNPMKLFIQMCNYTQYEKRGTLYGPNSQKS